MIIASSAIMAMLLDEPERVRFGRAIDAAPAPRISAANFVELVSVSTRRFSGALDAELDALIASFRIATVPVTVDQAMIGSEAYRLFGRGTGHPAALNFGDCFAYALSKATGEPLLFKGDDFTHTDVVCALT